MAWLCLARAWTLPGTDNTSTTPPPEIGAAQAKSPPPRTGDKQKVLAGASLRSARDCRPRYSVWPKPLPAPKAEAKPGLVAPAPAEVAPAVAVPPSVSWAAPEALP